MNIEDISDVIFTQTTKFDGNGSRPLKPEEYGQMAGRAGRRGLDDFGTVIILPEEDMPNEKEAKNMLMAAPQKINSRLDIDYSFILKRLACKIDSKNDEKTNSYILESINNTMHATEHTLKYSGIDSQIEELKVKLDDYSELSSMFDDFIKYKELEEKLQTQQESGMHNKVNIEFLQKQVEKLLDDVEKLKDKQRDFTNGNSHD